MRQFKGSVIGERRSAQSLKRIQFSQFVTQGKQSSRFLDPLVGQHQGRIHLPQEAKTSSSSEQEKKKIWRPCLPLRQVGGILRWHWCFWHSCWAENLDGGCPSLWVPASITPSPTCATGTPTVPFLQLWVCQGLDTSRKSGEDDA